MNYLALIVFMASVALLTWILMIPTRKRKKYLQSIPGIVNQKVKELFPGQEGYVGMKAVGSEDVMDMLKDSAKDIVMGAVTGIRGYSVTVGDTYLLVFGNNEINLYPAKQDKKTCSIIPDPAKRMMITPAALSKVKYNRMTTTTTLFFKEGEKVSFDTSEQGFFLVPQKEEKQKYNRYIEHFKNVVEEANKN